MDSSDGMRQFIVAVQAYHEALREFGHTVEMWLEHVARNAKPKSANADLA
jgi:hypothetical protein